MKRILACLLAFVIVLSLTCSAAVELPMDTFDGGSVPIAENYTENGYSDDTITVEMRSEEGTIELNGVTYNTVYNVVEVWISSPSQLRTTIGGDVHTPRKTLIENMANRVNAVLTINGDFYPQRNGGMAIRQSQVIRETDNSQFELLIIDYNGDFHIITNDDKQTQIDALAGNIYQCFCFGPGLVIDGEIGSLVMDHDYGNFYMDKFQPRMAIGQLGPLHYIIVQVEGRNGESNGINGQLLAEYMLNLGCTQAYNLDGGNSAMIYFGGARVNDMTVSKERSLFDIIYFASATEEGQTEEQTEDVQ